MQDFEKLGAFYLGRIYDWEAGKARDELLLYDSKDLTTHAMCVGMTGSGKTGLCLSLLEEAAIDGVPAIVIDPKGDLGNLLLTFPDLAPADFRPWIDEGMAARAGLTAEQFAAETARLWRNGLAEWGQPPARIAKFRNSVDAAIYTPGSNAGLPLTVLRSFAAPPRSVLDDADALREQVGSATSGLLALLGIDADAVQSREHILISNLLERAWQEERDLDVASLIRDIQSPPLKTVGVFDLDTFFPPDRRLELAMRLNNLLASPSFAGWMEGEPLNVQRLLYTDAGKPRLSIISIAHLSDAERMFFVTTLLNEVVAWVRCQPGTSSLRALLYMDEVFGFFPPMANPPSKRPMLTLLKQARAYGLGVVLATQNPVDLDYKGLSNMGTWFLGRLQTERDKARVLEGLEGASALSGSTFDRQLMERRLAGLQSRVFLMNNVHEDQPVVFQTRWALSYLRGPLTRTQIETLMASRKISSPTESGTAASAPAAAAQPARTPLPAAQQASAQPPMLPADVDQSYLPQQGQPADGARLVYRPPLLGSARVHFVKATWNVDEWQSRNYLCPIDDDVPEARWGEAYALREEDLQRENALEATAGFADVPPSLTNAKNYAQWQKDLKAHIYREEQLSVWHCAALKLYSQAGETEGDFRIRLRQAAREKRDLEVEKLRKRFASKLASLQSRIRSAEERVAREKSQATRASFDTAISVGASIVGALFGRKLASRTNVGRASASMRSVGRAAQQRGDVGLAEERVEDLRKKLDELEQNFEEEVKSLEEQYDVDSIELESKSIRPRKSDIPVEPIAVVWTPWVVDSNGMAAQAFQLPAE